MVMLFSSITTSTSGREEKTAPGRCGQGSGEPLLGRGLGHRIVSTRGAAGDCAGNGISSPIQVRFLGALWSKPENLTVNCVFALIAKSGPEVALFTTRCA